jgi:hypothetical protein
VTAPDEALEEGVALGALGYAGNPRVLPRDADAGVPRDERQEAGLTVGEAVLDDGLNALEDVEVARWRPFRFLPSPKATARLAAARAESHAREGVWGAVSIAARCAP